MAAPSRGGEPQPAPKNQQMPAVAANAELYFVVWADQRDFNNNEWDIYGARVSPEGRVLDPNGIRICALPGIQWFPAVVSDGRNFFVVWTDNRDPYGPTSYDIYGARVTAEGVVLDPNGFPISRAPVDQFGPSVAFNGTEYLVAWYDYRNSDDVRLRNDIYGARVSREGVVIDPEGIAICTADNMQWSPGVASLGGDFFVAWSDSRGQMRGTRVTGTGSVSNPDGLVLASYYSGYPVRVAANTSGYLAVWTDDRNYGATDFDIFGRRADVSGQLAPTDFPVYNTPDWQLGPALAASDDQFLAVWTDEMPGAFGHLTIRGTRIGSNGPLDRDGLLIGSQASAYALGGPAVASLNGQFLVAWVVGANTEIPGETDIVAARVDATGAILDSNPFLVSTVAPVPVDSDHDGVPDERDQCPNTPPGAVVDANGCSAEQRDSDHDGVSDDRDQCPGTPAGAVVDANGCSIAQLCPCDGDWRNHGEYVNCISSHAWEFFRAGLITAKGLQAALRDSSKSDCGKRDDHPPKRSRIRDKY